MKIGNFKIHPICAEVPDPTDEEYANMRASIEARGINKSVTLYGAEVVSGKTRVRIGTELGITIPTTKWFPKSKDQEGIDREIRELLLDEDFNRRHLKTGQRAVFIAPLINTSAGNQSGKITALSEDAAAEKAGVSPKTMQQARDVLEEGSAALVEAVREGEVSVSDAARIVDLPKAEQTAAVKAVESGEAKTVSAAAGKTRKPRKPKASSNGHPAAVEPLPIPDPPERDAGEDETEAAHQAPDAAVTTAINGKLTFDDNLIDQLFGKLIKAIDLRANVLKCKNSAEHSTCINRLDAFMVEFKKWKARRR